MIKFLISRPIAVTMSMVAVLLLGLASIGRIPVSLMPDIAIPRITVQISDPNTSARELENSVVRQVRQQLMQVGRLEDIRSETADGLSTLTLNFSYGTHVDYAFIEVNEKIDQAMNYLSNDLERPRVIKASAGDIPVFYLNLTQAKRASNSSNVSEANLQREASNFSNVSEANIKRERSELFPVTPEFVDLSRFASNVISKRLEQLPEIAMVDMSGLAKTEILIMPDLQKLEALGLTLNQLGNAIMQNNIKLGNLVIKDGQYQYNVRFASTLQSKADIESVYLKTSDRLYQLKDVAEVVEHPQKLSGMVLSNGQQAVSLAVIKQSDAKMNNLKAQLHQLVEHFRADYPDVEFELTRDQTALLDYSISNLKQNLVVGALLAFVIMFFFLRDFKSPFLIGISIPLSLVVSLLFFHLFGLSINIISLSGLILGVGMMVDNSIIVIDNITQHFDRARMQQGHPMDKARLVFDACVSGTNEVIRPMLSSVLTTCAVFVPLIFIEGISGALFYDQAMAVTIGLFASLVVSVTVLPVFYLLFYRKGTSVGANRWLRMVNGINYEKWYEVGFRFTMRHQPLVWTLVGLMLVGAVGTFKWLDKERLPHMQHSDAVVKIDWGERIHVEENRDRVLQLLNSVKPNVLQSTALIGQQQFLLGQVGAGAASEVELYLNARSEAGLDSALSVLALQFEKYKDVVVSTHEAGNIFNVVFSDDEAPFEIRLRATTDLGPSYNAELQKAHQQLEEVVVPYSAEPIVWQHHMVLKAAPERLLLYDVSYNSLYYKLKSLFNENNIFLISDNSDFIRVILGGKPRSIDELIQRTTIRNSRGDEIPIRELVQRGDGFDLKTIVAGKEGEYFPITMPLKPREAQPMMQTVKQHMQTNSNFEVSFAGSIFSNREMVWQLAVILLISLALLYFILASQFESLTLPLLVLVEVPIDLCGAFLFLKLFGSSINLMALIGIVVMSGIVINDSILKVDTVKRLQAEGYSLLRALAEGGRRRLKPILMTSLTTVLALVPILFTHSFGSDLQRPLALAVIGGMTIGTLVSLFFVPLAYYYLRRKRNSK